MRRTTLSHTGIEKKSFFIFFIANPNTCQIAEKRIVFFTKAPKTITATTMRSGASISLDINGTKNISLSHQSKRHIPIEWFSTDWTTHWGSCSFVNKSTVDTLPFKFCVSIIQCFIV